MKIKTTIQNQLIRARTKILDRLRTSRTIWELSATAGMLQSYFARELSDKLRLQATAYRRTSSRFLRARIESQLAPWLGPKGVQIWRDKRIGWRESCGLSNVLDKSILLKAPVQKERGVLYVSFEYNWLRLISHCDLFSLLQDYFVVLASSSSPPDFPSHWALSHAGPTPIFLQVSNHSDCEIHSWQDHNIVPLRIMASDWVNPDFYAPRTHAHREIDILMVAGWSQMKRHWLLFDALRHMSRKLRVVLIGQDSEGRVANDVWREAKAFGVAERIEIVRDASIGLVTKHQCNSRISVALSAREGSCVVVTESLFADAPVAMMRNAHIGSRAYINSQTGELLQRKTISSQLSAMIEQSDRYGARNWALDNITCFHSLSNLNGALRRFSLKCNMPWTREIVPFCWRPNPEYINPSDAERMESAYRQLCEKFGIEVAGRAAQVGAENQVQWQGPTHGTGSTADARTP